MWVALNLKTEAEVAVLGRTAKLPFSDMADGCKGCLLVFDTREEAMEYSGEGGAIIEVAYTYTI